MTMTDGSIGSSTGESYKSNNNSQTSSSKEVENKSNADETVSTSETMLGVDFFTPLTGQARAERVKQMSSKHPAFQKSRESQEILVKIQQSLRRMPGVSANESAEIIEQLQQVGQIISQETSALVDALVKTQLDQEDTEKAVARMSLDNNLVKAEKDDLTQKANDLKKDLSAEVQKRQDAEMEAKKIMDDLYDLTKDFKAITQKSGGDSSPDRESVIKVVEETIKLLEDQVNNRRSLWLMKHSDPQSVAKAIETLADSVSDNPAAHRTLMALKPAIWRSDDKSDSSDISRMINEFPAPGRSGSAFQPIHRPPTSGPPKMGYFQNRSFSSTSHSRRHGSAWGGNTGGPGGGGGGGGYGHSRQPSSAASMSSMSSFSRMPGRKVLNSGSGNNNNNSSRFSPCSTDSQPWNYDDRSGSAFARGNGGGSGSGSGRDYYPRTPTGQGRGGNRHHHNRFQDMSAPAASTPTSTAGNEFALVRSNNNAAPLIHLSEQFVNTWDEGIMEFYATARTFVERHSVSPDQQLAQVTSNTPLWSILLATYYPLSEAEAASYLEFHLRNESSKSCLITRVIVDYIVNRVWIPGAWTGSDNDSTYALLDLERELEKMHGKPSALRQPLLDKQAAIVEDIIHAEHSGAFFRGKVDEITRTLVNNLQPLIDKRSTQTEAFRDMEQIAEQAWELSSKIMTSRLTFDFRFPEIGSRFSSQSMLPIWPQMDPLELQAKHWRVALVTTPVITCRNDTGANISAHSVALADVFCMQ